MNEYLEVDREQESGKARKRANKDVLFCAHACGWV